jgi:peptidylprolyl isomerase
VGLKVILAFGHRYISLKELDMSNKEDKEAPAERPSDNREIEVRSVEEIEEIREEEPSDTKTIEKPLNVKQEKKTKKVQKEKSEKKADETVAKGDFIFLEMTGRALETDEIFETTDEELAKRGGIFDENRAYGPRLVVVGEGWVLKGLDDRLEGFKINESAEIEIPPKEAFGERSPENVKTMPFRNLRSKGVNPVIGQQVEIDGRTAIVRSVGAGRVQLDYNHPLAGRKIIYHVKVTKHFKGDEDKIRALISRRFSGIDTERFKLKLLKKKVRITIPDEVFFGENIQLAKRGVALDIQRYFSEFDEVEYTEVIKRSS